MTPSTAIERTSSPSRPNRPRAEHPPERVAWIVYLRKYEVTVNRKQTKRITSSRNTNEHKRRTCLLLFSLCPVHRSLFPVHCNFVIWEIDNRSYSLLLDVPLVVSSGRWRGRAFGSATLAFEGVIISNAGVQVSGIYMGDNRGQSGVQNNFCRFSGVCFPPRFSQKGD